MTMVNIWVSIDVDIEDVQQPVHKGSTLSRSSCAQDECISQGSSIPSGICHLSNLMSGAADFILTLRFFPTGEPEFDPPFQRLKLVI